MALSTRPLFSACSASIRSSRPLRASTYFVARRVDHRVLLVVDLALELLELVVDLLRRLGADLLQVGGEALDVRRDLGPAGRDPLLRRAQVGADDVGDPRDDAVHLLEVELAAGLVELVDLVGHPEQLVLGPAQAAQPPAVAVLLVRRHLGGDVRLERRSGARPRPSRTPRPPWGRCRRGSSSRRPRWRRRWPGSSPSPRRASPRPSTSSCPCPRPAWPAPLPWRPAFR